VSEKLVILGSNPKSLHALNDTRLTPKSHTHITQNLQYYLAALVSLLTFIVYSFSLQNSFVVSWDDGTYIINNPFISSFNKNFFKWAFFDFYASNWHPLTWISHALDYAAWGWNPLGHHLSNNLLHAANTSAVVVLVTKLMEARRETTAKKAASAFLENRTILITGGLTGLLFGLHPIHVESVAWISERKDLLCGLFFLLSILAYTKYVRHIDNESVHKKLKLHFINKHYLLTLGFFVFALLSKPMAVSLPCVLLLLDWYPFSRNQSFKSLRAMFFEKIPFFTLSLISSILTILAQRAGDAMGMMEFVPFSERALVAVKSLVAYLWKIILPVNLIPFYPYPLNVSLFSLKYLSVSVLVLGITVACVIAVKKEKLFLSVWVYYVITLIPVLGIVQVGGQSMADRYTYLPSIGPFLIIALVVAWLWKKVYTIKKWGMYFELVSLAAAIFLFIPVIYLTVNQISIWENSITLWDYVIKKGPVEVPRAYYNRGYAYRDLGQPYKAIEDFDKAIALNPVNYEAFNLRGLAFMDIGQFNKSIEDFNRSIAINPRYFEGYFNRGIAFSKLGFYDKAIESVTASLEITPNSVAAYIERGINYVLIRNHDRALKDFNHAIYFNQNNALAYYNRAYLYLVIGSKNLAMSDYKKACDLGYSEGCKKLREF